MLIVVYQDNNIINAKLVKLNLKSGKYISVNRKKCKIYKIHKIGQASYTSVKTTAKLFVSKIVFFYWIYDLFNF